MTGAGLDIAVVGGGIAGLTAAYRLGLRHRVTVYERHPTPGLAVHGATGANGSGRVDIPLRVFTEAHYRQLLALYAELGVETEAIPHSCSYSVRHGAREPVDTYLRYGVGEEGTSGENVAISDHGRALVNEHTTFVEHAVRDHLGGQTRGKSLSAYAAGLPVSRDYVEHFLIPSFAGICTCSFATAERFPADVALDLLLSGTGRMGLRRVRGGAAAAAERFLERLSDFRGSTTVRRIGRHGAGVRVIDDGGGANTFDHVVVATPANVVPELVALSAEEDDALTSVRYEAVRVVVHHDASLVPAEGWRGAFNFVVDTVSRETSATIWVNAIQSGLDQAMFQTVNPVAEPREEDVLQDMVLERASVDADSADVGERVESLHDDPYRRVWFCGAYARRGVPLLETGVASANAVAASIEARAQETRASA